MSSLQSLREFISERLAAAAEEIFRHCEGTIVQYEQELCRQRRLLDICWKPQLQLDAIVLPQHYVSEKEDNSNQQKNSRVKQKEPERPQIKVEKEEPELPQTEEEWKEPEPPQMKEEEEELCISQDEDHLQFKQQTDPLMETFTYKNEHNVLDLKNLQSFYGGEDGNQHVQNIDAESQSDSDVIKKPNITTLIRKRIDSLKEKRLSFMKSCKSSRTVSNLYVYKRTQYERPCVCKECGKSFRYWSKLRLHMRVHTGEKPFSCKLCDTRFGQTSSLKRHMMIHTGEKPFSCNECAKSFRRLYNLKEHMRTHAERKTFSYLNAHVKTHTGEAFFL